MTPMPIPSLTPQPIESSPRKPKTMIVVPEIADREKSVDAVMHSAKQVDWPMPAPQPKQRESKQMASEHVGSLPDDDDLLRASVRSSVPLNLYSGGL